MTAISSSYGSSTTTIAGDSTTSATQSTASTSAQTGAGALGVYALPGEGDVMTTTDAGEPIPELDVPWIQTLPRSSLGMIAASLMQQIVSEQMLDNLMAGIGKQRDLIQELTDKAVKQIEADCKKAESIEQQKKAARVIGWVKAIGGLVLAVAICAVAATVAIKSGGLAGKPMMYAGIMAMQSGISGVMAMSDSNFKGYYVGEVTSSTTAALEKMDVNSQDAAKVAIAVGVLVALYAGLSGSAAGDAAQKAKTLADVIKITNMLFSGSVSISEGVNNRQLAELEYAKAMIVADGKEAQADMDRAQMLLDIFRQMFETVMYANQKRNDSVSETLQSDAASLGAVINNFS